MHKFNPGQDVFGRVKRFEIEHRPDHAFDGAMVLFNDIVEVFDLTDLEGIIPVFVDRLNRGSVAIRRQW